MFHLHAVIMLESQPQTSLSQMFIISPSIFTKTLNHRLLDEFQLSKYQLKKFLPAEGQNLLQAIISVLYFTAAVAGLFKKTLSLLGLFRFYYIY